MKDDFEAQLRQQPLRAVPKGWKREILDSPTRSAETGKSGSLNRAAERWTRFLDRVFAHPRVSLAAVWAVIAMLRFTSPDVGGGKAVAEQPLRSWHDSVVRLAAIERQLFDLAPENTGPREKARKTGESNWFKRQWVYPRRSFVQSYSQV